ncbi:MAG: cytochrome b/b6 domain-containing protein [Actinobacteria bacterium]|nr:cytochrome b/b6 domain-containing protein [Actinomycetota bacterium]
MSTDKQILPAFVERFNKHQRMQHLLLMISVLALIITGFPIKYGYMAWSAKVVSFFGSFTVMFYIHLTAAVLMLLSGAYHLLWILFNFRERKTWGTIPNLKDLTDAVDHFQYLLGIRKDPPQFGRYTYLEKFEYLALVWGIPVMGLSGFILWFPERAAAWLPRWALDVTRIVHSNEAFLATLALAVGHFYAVHFNPGVFPSSSVWYNGKISRHHLAEEHPLEYQQLVEESQRKGLTFDEPDHHPRLAGSKPYMMLLLGVYTVLFLLMLKTFIPMLLS